MRIGVDIRTLMDARYSGVSEYTYNLLTHMLKFDKGNKYCLFYNSLKDVSPNIPNFKNTNIEYVKYSYPNKLLNYFLFKPFNLPKIDKRLGLDMIFMPHINFIGLTRRKPSVLTIHDLSYIRYREYFSLRKNIWHKLINVKKLINNFSHVVAVSENTKADIVELCNVDDTRVSVIHSGINPSFRQLSRGNEKDNSELEKVKNKYHLPDDFILFLGTVEPRKNIIGLMMAYDMLVKDDKVGEYNLIIAGMDGWKSKDIYKTWENLECKERIKFIGYVDKDDKRAIYNLAKVFVYPSFYEGLVSRR